MPGIERVIDHLATHFNLSETETRRLLTELSNSILIGCCLEEKVLLPHLGTFTLTEDKLNYVPSIYALEFCQNVKCVKPPAPRDPKAHRSSQPDRVRQSLFDYLSLDYASAKEWEHPNGSLYSYDRVYNAIGIISKLNDDYFDILYARLVSNRRRGQIAEAYMYSEASIKRRCDAVLASLLLVLIHPELAGSAVSKLYRLK